MFGLSSVLLGNFYKEQHPDATSSEAQQSCCTHCTRPAASWQLNKNIADASLHNLGNRNSRTQKSANQDAVDETSDRQDSPPLFSEPQRRNQTDGYQSKHSIKQEQKYNNWLKKLDELRQQRLQHLPTRLATTLRQQQAEVGFVQGVLEESWRYHQCRCREEDQDQRDEGCTMDKVRSYSVTYFSFNSRCIIHIPVWRCKVCQMTFTPVPSMVNCWGSSPGVQSWWIHESVLMAYHEWVGEGIGSDGKSGHISTSSMV